MTDRRIAILTGSRAEYGLLHWLIRDLNEAPEVDLQLIVTGAHLSPQFGETWRAIASDGWPIAAKAEILLDGDTGTAMATSLGLAVIKLGDVLATLRPDILVLLGDRFEVLAAASAAACLRIPIAHIHGGEATEGAIDDMLRHAVTAMSRLHFVATEAFAQRVIEIGAHPSRVFTVGAIGIDNLQNLELPDQAALEQELGFEFGDQALLVTYHPATMSAIAPEAGATELLAALERFPASSILITGANSDPGGRTVNRLVGAWVDKAATRRVLTRPSLGLRNYLAALKAAAVVVGNSSSGIIEAPAAGKPVVNIGSRQKGRPRAPSVIDCAESRHEIVAAIERALSPEFRALAALGHTPYGRGGAAAAITATLKGVALDQPR